MRLAIPSPAAPHLLVVLYATVEPDDRLVLRPPA